LTEEERTSIFAAPEFLDFIEQSSKIVQRALNDNYDYIRDYSIGTETGGYDVSYYLNGHSLNLHTQR
jgi:dynein intermediate chain, cytosolic